ncbi:helix-turn-helix domain-containing protein [Bacillus smithii]|mgnify:CR=1 FL=1|uniref:helix-turn-helix domain-containing protein n=1 Tax=Bacillus smithii TaxID=1479 RepID=UPI0030C94589
MGKIRKTYDVKFKKKAVDLYLKEGMGYKTVAKELGIDDSMVRRWVKHHEQEGIQGLEEKRGKAKGPIKEDRELAQKILKRKSNVLRRKLRC